MPIYIQFDIESGRQLQATTLSKKPEGVGWRRAPEDFAWHKHYILAEDRKQIVEQHNKSMLNSLENNRSWILAQAKMLINEERKIILGGSLEKAHARTIQAKVAASVLADPTPENITLIEPLANKRAPLVVAKEILAEEYALNQAIIKLEAMENKTIEKLEKAVSSAELEQIMNNIKEIIG